MKHLRHFWISRRKAFLGALLCVALIQSISPMAVFADTASSTSDGINTAPSSPVISEGTNSGLTGTSYTFSAQSNDLQGDQVSYGFDWDNDGVVDGWTGYVASGASAQLAHAWASAGSYTFAVTAKDQWGAPSSPTFFSITINDAVSPVATSTPSGSGTSTGGTGTTTGSTTTASTTPGAGSTGSGSSGGGASAGSSAPVASNNGGVNTAPNTPTVFGPSTALANSALTFSATAIDPQNDQVAYGFDWNNDGVVDEWTAYHDSGSLVAVTHSWSAPGMITIQVQAKDLWGAPSNPAPFQVSVGQASTTSAVNTAPNTPTVSLPAAPVAGTSYTITATAIDPQNDQVAYGFDWNNDGVVDEWTGYVASGASASISHVWQNAGSQSLSAVAKDQWGAPSDPFTATVNVSAANNGGGNGSGGNGGGNNGGGTGTTTPPGGNGTGTTTPPGGNGTGTTTPPGGNGTGTTTPPGGDTGKGGGSGGSGSSGGGGTYTGPCFGYNCQLASGAGSTSGGSAPLPGDIQILIGSNNPTSNRPTGPEQVCPATNFIQTFLRYGADNDPTEVKKLQYFLNTYENAGLPVSGTFDAATQVAVESFQAKYSQDILAPWGTTTPTGIVYLTTTRKINSIYCGDHPGYAGNQDLKDILGNDVLNGSPLPSNPSQFQGVIGQNTATSTVISNIAGVFGALSSRVLDALQSIPIYQLLILLLILLGTAFTLQGTFIKDIKSYGAYAALMRGVALLAVGSVLNVLNTLSFMLNPDWLSQHLGLSLAWVLGLDMVNALGVVAIALGVLIALHQRMSSIEAGK